MDIPALRTSELTSLNVKTVQDWYQYIRKVLVSYQESERQELFS